mgnify:FL=1
MIKVKNLSKSFNKQLVLDNISIDINKGDFISIVGPSGAGKTTFLNILGTIDDYDKNPKTSILFNGTDLTKLNDDNLSSFRNKEIGFIFQFHQLLPELTAQENILLPSMIGKNNEKTSLNNLNKLSTILDIKSILEKKPEFISGGEKQRVAVARALINSPSILLADEPTGNLDSKNADIIQKLFKKINKDLNLTIILVTHNTKFSKIADKCMVMKDGKWSN